MDRCDRCPAAAAVRVRLNGSDLLFCGHHFQANEAALSAAGAVVTEDAREGVTPDRPAPAPVVQPEPGTASGPIHPDDRDHGLPHRNPGLRAVKEALPDSTIRVTRTNEHGRLSDGPAGEPAILVTEQRTGRPVRIEHFDDGRRHDSMTGEAAELWFFNDGQLFTRRHYNRGLLDDTMDEPAICYLSPTGQIVSQESWTLGRRNSR